MSNLNTFKKFEKELIKLKEELKGQETLDIIYNKQCKLMERYGHDPVWLKTAFEEANDGTFTAVQKDSRTKLLLDMVHALGSEVSEFRDELPWKHWKNYKEEDKWYNNEDTKTAAGFELIDIMTFLMESFILLGYDVEDMKALYLTKWLENNHRISVGYDKNYQEDQEDQEEQDDKAWSLGHS